MLQRPTRSELRKRAIKIVYKERSTIARGKVVAQATCLLPAHAYLRAQDWWGEDTRFCRVRASRKTTAPSNLLSSCIAKNALTPASLSSWFCCGQQDVAFWLPSLRCQLYVEMGHLLYSGFPWLPQACALSATATLRVETVQHAVSFFLRGHQTQTSCK